MGALSYLSEYGSRKTVKNYEDSLKVFFEAVYGIREPLDSLAERYFREKRDYEEDVQTLLIHIKDVAPKSKKLRLSAVRVFLTENDVDLGAKFWRRIRGRVKGSRAVTIDKVPTHEEYRKIMNHLPVQGRALFTVLLSSGMRIGEALKVKEEDLDFNEDPVRVNLRGEYTKSGNSRVTFISRESKEAVQSWLRVRSSYLDAAAKKSTRHRKAHENPALFPFTGVNAYHMWNTALCKAGFDGRDQQTNFHRMHPHVLRKFFRTKLGSVIPIDVVEALMGHEGYLTEVYRKYSVEDLSKFYKEGEHALLVFTEAGEVSKLKQEIEERYKDLEGQRSYLMGRIMELEARIKRTEDVLNKILEKLG